MSAAPMIDVGNDGAEEFETITLNLPNKDAEAIERIAQITGETFDEIAERVLRKYLNHVSRLPGAHFVLFEDRAFQLSADCTGDGELAVGHVERFLDSIKAQLRGLYFQLDESEDSDDNVTQLDRSGLRDYVTGVQLLVDLSIAMIQTAKK